MNLLHFVGKYKYIFVSNVVFIAFYVIVYSCLIATITGTLLILICVRRHVFASCPTNNGIRIGVIELLQYCEALFLIYCIVVIILAHFFWALRQFNSALYSAGCIQFYWIPKS